MVTPVEMQHILPEGRTQVDGTDLELTCEYTTKESHTPWDWRRFMCLSGNIAAGRLKLLSFSLSAVKARGSVPSLGKMTEKLLRETAPWVGLGWVVGIGHG